MSSPADKLNHFYSLDGLRALGISLVVWFHLWQQSWWWPDFSLFGIPLNLNFVPATGFMGVEILIVIGSFGLFYPYVRGKFHGTPVRPLREFAMRRFLRIVPSYYLMILLTLILSQGTVVVRNVDAWHVIRHLLFIQNLFPDTLLGSFNSVAWFVAMHVQFYLLFPLLCRAFLTSPWVTFGVLQMVAIGYRAYVFHFEYDQLSYLLNQLIGYLDIYADGMAAAYLTGWLSDKVERVPKLRFFLTALAIVTLLLYFELMRYLCLTSYSHIQDGQLLTREYFGLILMVLVTSSAFAGFPFLHLIANRGMLFIAAISYNLFLWHQWVAVQFRLRGLIPSVHPDPHTDPHWQLIYTLAVLSVSVILATVLTYGFERPVGKWLNQWVAGFYPSALKRLCRIGSASCSSCQERS